MNPPRGKAPVEAGGNRPANEVASAAHSEPRHREPPRFDIACTDPAHPNVAGANANPVEASSAAGEPGSARRSIGSIVATGRGDDGTTGLLFGGPRILKDDLRTEAYGTVDEAVAALGLARAELALKRQYGVVPPTLGGLSDVVLRLQRELFIVGAELATTPDAWGRLVDGQTRVSAAMVRELERVLLETEGHITMPHEFVVPGETRTSAALELARTIVRRAERRAVTLQRAGQVPGDYLLPYLNRLADLLWVLARAAEQAEARGATPARTSRRRRLEPTEAGISNGATQE